MREETRRSLKAFVLTFARRKIRPLQNVSVEDLRRAFPFHDLFFRDEALLAFKLQRSIVTSLGRSFYAQIAQIIGRDKYTKALLEHTVECALPGNMCDAIERIVTNLRIGCANPHIL